MTYVPQMLKVLLEVRRVNVESWICGLNGEQLVGLILQLLLLPFEVIQLVRNLRPRDLLALEPL